MVGKRCCFTGHRPEKLRISEPEIKRMLKKAIAEAVDDGFLTFYSGMSRGIDMWAAEIVLEMKKSNSDINLICAVPYKGFEKGWRFEERELYRSIIERADCVEYICEHYFSSCFQIRNVYMVNRSQRVIAAYIGERGGTQNTIAYAQKEDIDIVNIFEQR